MLSKENMDVLINIIGAVETGGQIYGKRRYAAYVGPYTNTPNEHTITIGWAGNYGPSAMQLMRMIFDRDPASFRKLDGAGIEGMLSKDWVSLRWNPTSAQKAAIIRIIDSSVGRKCQDDLFASQMESVVAECEKKYTKDIKAVMMYCEIRHLGGANAAKRIFDRCKGNYSLDNIMNALKLDQADTSSSNQVGDSIFWSRHVKCKEFIEKYAVVGTKPSPSPAPTPTPPSNAVKVIKKYQKWMNTYYPNQVKLVTGKLLDEDGSFGRLTRAATVAVWKHMANKYYGGNLTIGNSNFLNSCKVIASKMTFSSVQKHTTLAIILQGLLAKNLWYLGDIDGLLGGQSQSGIIKARITYGLSNEVKLDSNLWYRLFN